MKKYILPTVDKEGLAPVTVKQINSLEAVSSEILENYIKLHEQFTLAKDEITVLKGEKIRPVFKPSRMHEEAGQTEKYVDKPSSEKRPGSQKKNKTATLKVDQVLIITPTEPIPEGSRFKGYRDFVVQDILITPFNTRYRLACWQTPDGQYLVGKLPASLRGGHFGATLVSNILYQHHQCLVTQPLLHEQLREWGIDISTGQIDAILQNDKASFHVEKDALLSTGLALSSYVTVDDTGARHQGNNGYVTHIGNELFAWFQSSKSKDRINFLELLRAGQTNYTVNEEALTYMKKQGLSQVFLDALSGHEFVDFPDKASWHAHLDTLGMEAARYRKIATEGALLGSLKELPIASNLAIISDDAGQFNILIHGLCWVHAERLIHKMLPLNELNRIDIAKVRSQVWDFYADLKRYKLNPQEQQKEELRTRFDAIFTQKTSYTSLDMLLKRLHKNKSELLLVLERPEIPLHTNGSEGDIRDHVRKRKVSGGTRSDTGQQCRDTFSSLKKTCRKLGVSFWDYLVDRISCSDQIPPLQDIIAQRMASA